jgi:hypothetical protein
MVTPAHHRQSDVDENHIDPRPSLNREVIDDLAPSRQEAAALLGGNGTTSLRVRGTCPQKQ